MKKALLLAALLPVSIMAQTEVAPMLDAAYSDLNDEIPARRLAPAAVSNVTEIALEVKFLQSDCRAMLPLINALRTGPDAWYWNEDNETKTVCTDLQPLAIDATLEQMAMQRAAEQVVYYSHTRPDGRNCWSIYNDYKVNWQAVAENIAVGQRTYTDAYTAWEEADKAYAKQGHRRNLLNSNYNAIGIGGAEYGGIRVWAQCLCKKTLNGNLPEANDVLTVVTIQMDDLHVTDLYSMSPVDPNYTFTTVSDFEVSTSLATNAKMDARLDVDFNTDGWISESLKNYYPWWSKKQEITATVSPQWSVTPSSALGVNSTTLTRLTQDEATAITTVFSQEFRIGFKPAIEGDINGDGVVNVADVIAYINLGGSAPDLNGDNNINRDDLLVICNKVLEQENR